MKKILIGSLHHESNGFSPIITNENDFRILYGAEIFDNLKENDAISGIVRTLQKQNYTLIPTLFMRGVPNGQLDLDFFNLIKKQLIDIAAQYQNEIDGICFHLHGSMSVDGLGEAEGHILEELRELYPNTPLYISLDMHASISEKMYHYVDGMVGYKTAPHIDCTETGIHAAKMLIEVLENNVKTSKSWVRMPMIVAGERSGTDIEPMKSLIAKLKEKEENEQILAASYLLGFPWTDNVDNTISVVVITKDNQALADATAIELAEIFWNKRQEFIFVSPAYSPEEAYRLALQESNQPIYISDSGDNPTACSAADNTQFLSFILSKKPEVKLLYAGFYDPHATLLCKDQVGKSIELSFGAKFDSQQSQAIESKVTVKAYREDYNYANIMVGDVALISSGNVDIILAEKHIGFTSTDLFYSLGMNPLDYKIIIPKLGYLTPDHQAIAAKSLFALTQGHTNQAIESIDYKHHHQDYYPANPNLEFEIKPEFNK